MNETKKRMQISLTKNTFSELEKEYKKRGLQKSIIIELALIEYFRKSN